MVFDRSIMVNDDSYNVGDNGLMVYQEVHIALYHRRNSGTLWVSVEHDLARCSTSAFVSNFPWDGSPEVGKNRPQCVPLNVGVYFGRDMLIPALSFLWFFIDSYLQMGRSDAAAAFRSSQIAMSGTETIRLEWLIVVCQSVCWNHDSGIQDRFGEVPSPPCPKNQCVHSGNWHRPWNYSSSPVSSARCFVLTEIHGSFAVLLQALSWVFVR